MKYILLLLLPIFLTGCIYTEENHSDIISAKSELHLYMDQDVFDFLEKEDAERTDKDYSFRIKVSILDNTYNTTYVVDNAEVKIHGESTIKYKKKSLALDIQESRLFFDFPYRTDEFFLVAMAEDAGYIHNVIGYSMAKEVGLFPAHFEMVHVYMNDIYRGLYLLTEKMQHGIQNNIGGISTIYRRNYGPNFNFKYSSPDLSEQDVSNEKKRLLSIYEIVDSYSGRALRDSLGELIDIPMYCRWLAVNAILRNGDYLDEVFFYKQNGSERYLVAGWDYDDIFKPPHGNNDFETSLIYCNEDPLDEAIGNDSILYDIFLNEYEKLVTNVLSDSYIAQMKKTVEDVVLSEFNNSLVADRMNNFSTSSEAAYQELKMLIDSRFSEITYRRDSLRIALH